MHPRKSPDIPVSLPTALWVLTAQWVFGAVCCTHCWMPEISLKPQRCITKFGYHFCCADYHSPELKATSLSLPVYILLCNIVWSLKSAHVVLTASASYLWQWPSVCSQKTRLICSFFWFFVLWFSSISQETRSECFHGVFMIADHFSWWRQDHRLRKSSDICCCPMTNYSPSNILACDGWQHVWWK